MPVEKKVLIILEPSTHPVDLGQPVHLGPLYILSYLESRGIHADFLDRQAERRRKLDVEHYSIIGFSVNVNNVTNSVKSASRIKKSHPQTQIVFGGPFATAYPELLLKNAFIDAVVAGEGELTFYELVSGMDKSKIRGLHFKENGAMRFGGPRAWNRDLDALPFPAIHRLDLRRYNMFYSRELPVSSIITSRGCPFDCAFCFHNMGHEWRERSPGNVADEIEWQVNKLGVKELMIVDDNFTFNRERAERIFDEIIRRKIKVSIQYANGVRADLLDKNLLEKAKAAGVWVLTVAPETGSPETLKKLNKKFKLDDTRRAIRLAKEAGLATEAFFLVGLPDETEEDLRETLRFAESLDTDFVTLSRFISFPQNRLTDATKFDFSNPEDNSYLGITPGNDRMLRKILAPFYFKFYFSPKRFFRVFRILKMYSISKFARPRVLGSLMLNIWVKLKNYVAQMVSP
jgi:radical SAM superfamily enzyme YgiQ (UPF0313 family)